MGKLCSLWTFHEDNAHSICLFIQIIQLYISSLKINIFPWCIEHIITAAQYQ